MSSVKQGLLGLASLVVVTWLIALPVRAAYAGPVAGQKLAFMGDSITQFGFQNPGGYVNLVAMTLEKYGNKIEIVPAGVSGNTSRDMLKRLQRDVLDKKPDWMTLSCGVNDVWHGQTGVDLETYKKNITSIVDQATAAGIKVVILTSTMIMENQDNPLNQQLIPYNDFLRSLATEKHLPLADLNAEMQAAFVKGRAEAGKGGYHLTVDGVHMNGMGNQMMAAGVLKAFGVTDAQLAEEKTAWDDLPGAMIFNIKYTMTVRQFQQLQMTPEGQRKPVDQILTDDLDKAMQNELNAPPPPPAPAAPAPSTP